MGRITLKDIQDVLSGKILTREAVRKQRGVIALVLLGICLYINGGYVAQHQHAKIAQLNEQIADAKFDYLNVFTILTQKTRQSEIEKALKERGSQVQPSLEPAIRIE